MTEIKLRPSDDFIPGLVVPAIFIIDPQRGRMLEFCGTGFLVADGVFVTCWHCVAATPPEGTVYAACRKSEEGTYKAQVLQDITQAPDGSDLATARADFRADVHFRLFDGKPAHGMACWSVGYPLTEKLAEEEFAIAPRYLQGYVMRDFYYRHPTRGRVRSYELDMPTPAGLSGAPLALYGSDQLVGVVYGVNSVAMAEELASVDPETGQRNPEVQRIVTFGLAHSIESLRSLTGPATGGRRVGELLGETR